MKKLIVALILASFSLSAQACCTPQRDSKGHILRSRTAVNHFKAKNVCPSTHKFGGSCPGYVVDHPIPLCACGLDDPSNMQWQTLADSKIKDQREVKLCKGLKAG